MSQERWDVVLRVVTGALANRGDVVCRGPVVRLGADPGPGGFALPGYRGLDDRQAVITAYDGGTVAIAPVGGNQVRVGPHEGLTWDEVPPIREPRYITPGEAFHLGPPNRGATLIYVDVRRLGVWEQGQILSEAQDDQAADNLVEEIDVARGMPGWFIGGMLTLAVVTAAGLILSIVPGLLPEPPLLGVRDEGRERVEFVEATETVDPALIEGLEQPFRDFVMVPNANRADWPELADMTGRWDRRFLDFVTRSAKAHGQGRRFWMRLEEITDDYAYVTSALRDAGLPEVLAAIPYWESGYKSNNQSYLCAQGYWQLMPEVAHRMNVQVTGCRLRGSTVPWQPTAFTPGINLRKNAPYIDADTESCRIQGCQVDERQDLALSTKAAVTLLSEAYNDPVLAETGAVVQLTILSHHAGYDDSRYLPNGRVKKVNMLPATQRYQSAVGKRRVPGIVGDNLRCDSPKSENWCGSVFDPYTQHYGYNIVAEHILAVCYYARNYDDLAVFQPWVDYTIGSGYCQKIDVPDTAQVQQWLRQ